MAGSSNILVKRFAVSVFVALAAAASAGAVVSVTSASHAHARTADHPAVKWDGPASAPSPSSASS